MPVRSPSSSIFRPKGGVDQSVMEDNKKLVADINRRNLLRGTVSLGALTMLTGCTVSDSNAVQAVLRAVSSFNDGVQELMFRPNHLAPTYREDQVVKPPRFNAFYDVDDVKPVDAKHGSWSWPAASITRRHGAPNRSTSYRSRNSSFGTSASRDGIISDSGPA